VPEGEYRLRVHTVSVGGRPSPVRRIDGRCCCAQAVFAVSSGSASALAGVDASRCSPPARGRREVLQGRRRSEIGHDRPCHVGRATFDRTTCLPSPGAGVVPAARPAGSDFCAWGVLRSATCPQKDCQTSTNRHTCQRSKRVSVQVGTPPRTVGGAHLVGPLPAGSSTGPGSPAGQRSPPTRAPRVGAALTL
jgi:hypothetical protein